jgi:serine/threonine protein kinase
VEEGKLLAKLTHPHIVRVYETIEDPGPTLILETLTGETLAHLIDTSNRRLPIRDLVHLGLHLCSALHYLHGHGTLHLDLKPSNIVSENQRAKILDLSIARPPGPGRPGAGTRQYMAPEQVTGREVSPASDVWGLGAVLYEAATDVTPFNAEYETESGTFTETEGSGPTTGDEYGSTYETEDPESFEQITRRVEPIGAHRRVPRAFGDIVTRCLDPDPSARPTLAELARTLTTLT